MHCRVFRTIETQYKRPLKPLIPLALHTTGLITTITVAGWRGRRRNGTLYTHYDSAVLICIHIWSLLYAFLTKILPRRQNTPQGRTIQGDSIKDFKKNHCYFYDPPSPTVVRPLCKFRAP